MALMAGDGDLAAAGDETVRFGAEADLARLISRQRRKREEMLGAHHFSDPVWDIMLDLFAAQVGGEEVAVSTLFIAAIVPQSTGFRHIRRLIQEGALIAHDDPRDGRRTFVRLSASLFEQIGNFLQQSLAVAGISPGAR